MSIIEETVLNKEYPILISLDATKQILFQMENCLCNINNNGRKATGFFCKFPFNHCLLPVLITNHSVLNENDKNISLTINNKAKIIKLDKSRKKYINLDNKISIIEIKPNKDKIYNFLEIDENYINNTYKNQTVFMLQYPNEQSEVSYGLISDIIDNKVIKHYCYSEEGSSGSPILSLNTFKVIGIHYSQKNKSFNSGLFIKYIIDEFNRYKNEINILYKTDKESEVNIFGKQFVQNNKNNIELVINGNKIDLINRYKLKKGENIIKIIIKNKITNLEYMFYNCESLQNIKELEYMDTRDISNFDWMFSECSLLSDINGLEKWNVSNGNNFSNMFSECSLLSDINGLENWNVSNGNNFSYMFSECSSLKNLKGLEKWNVSNGNDFSYMFSKCSSLKNLKGLENWNVSNGNNFSSMFWGCFSLLDINNYKIGIYQIKDSKYNFI